MEYRRTQYQGVDKYQTPRMNKINDYVKGGTAFQSLIRRWFGEDVAYAELGSGTYGNVFTMTMTQDIRDRFKKKYGGRMDDRVGHVSDVPLGHPIAVKISLMTGPMASWYAMMLREMEVHYALRHAESVVIHDKKFSIRQYIPALYFAGIDPDVRACVMMMQYLPGVPLFIRVRETRVVSPNLMAQFEHALLSMWLSGYFHLDLHLNNIFYDTDRRLKFIDFGLAVKIPDEHVAMLKSYLAGNVPGVDPSQAIQAFWASYGHDFAEKVIASRAVNLQTTKSYYSNYYTWEYLEKHPDISRIHELDKARRRWWIPTPCDQLKDGTRTQQETCTGTKRKGFFSVFGGR